VTELVARLILAPLAELAGNSAAELAFFRTFGQKGSRELLLMLLEDGRLTELLADELWPQFVALATPGAASASELHAKFAGEGQGFELEYVELKNFFRGLEAVVGSPNPNVLATMRREHCNEGARHAVHTPHHQYQSQYQHQYQSQYQPQYQRQSPQRVTITHRQPPRHGTVW
jgi:hypothetical protein